MSIPVPSQFHLFKELLFLLVRACVPTAFRCFLPPIATLLHMCFGVFCSISKFLAPLVRFTLETGCGWFCSLQFAVRHQTCPWPERAIDATVWSGHQTPELSPNVRAPPIYRFSLVPRNCQFPRFKHAVFMTEESKFIFCLKN